MNAFEMFLFQYYPYVCLSVFVVGSLIRFDRDQYTWKSDSSQMLRATQLKWGSTLFHTGILLLFFGHLFGMLTPHWLYAPFMEAGTKQMIAVYAGGVFGVITFIGLSILLHRRFTDPRIRLTSRRSDMAVLIILWIQLVIGLSTLPSSLHHTDGELMMALADGAQRIMTFRPIDQAALASIPWHYKLHVLLGATLFLLFPFTRLVHVWSGFAALTYVLRPHQLVRSRRLNLPENSPLPVARPKP
ncbi:MAG: respiratory nitrate reductase subunit gamma [Rhodocyclaceae bacterium]